MTSMTTHDPEYAERRRRHAQAYAAKKAEEYEAGRRWVVGFTTVVLWCLTGCLVVFLVSPGR